MQTLFDEAWPPGRIYYNKSSNIRRLTEPAIETMLEWGRTLPTPLSAIAMQQAHGAVSRVGAGETAFPHRYDHFTFLAHPATDDPADRQKITDWGRACWEAMQPHVERAVYVNALEDAVEEGEARVREAYGPNYDRLVALKRKYDPTNFFTANQNIKPAPDPRLRAAGATAAPPAR